MAGAEKGRLSLGLPLLYVRSPAFPLRGVPKPFEGGYRLLDSNDEKEVVLLGKRSKVVWKEIFCRYIVKNGKRIYPKRSKFFHFFIKVKDMD